MEKAQEVLTTAFDRPQWYVKGQAFNISIRVESVKYWTRNLKPENILDIGCGDGSLSLPLLDETNHLTFLDRSQGMLDLVFSRIPKGASDRIELLNTDFMAADLAEQSFDLIICVGVMAYVSDRPAFLAKIAKLLRPGGVLIIECSDSAHFYTHFNCFYEAVRIKVLGGAEFPTIKRSAAELRKLLEQAGFKEDEIYRYSLPPHVTKKFISQGTCYKLIRGLFGSAGANRAAGLGNECLFRFTRKSGS